MVGETTMNWILGLVIICTSPFWLCLGVVLIAIIGQMLIVIGAILIAAISEVLLQFINLFKRGKK